MVLNWLFGLVFFVGNSDAKKITVPINIGMGPALFQFNGDLGTTQPYFYGLHLDLAAVIDKDTIKANQKQIPKKYRNMVKNLGEVRISHALIPDTVFISPIINDTSVYGATFKPVGLNVPLVNKALRINVGVGLLFTYAHISESTRKTHFIRPGIDVRGKMDLKLHKRFLLSMGWASGFYPPQSLGGFGFGGESLWHIGQGFLMLNYRHPFKTRV